LKRLLIFCIYDKEGRADDYIFCYLDNIKRFCKEICIVVNGNLDNISKEKLSKYDSKIIFRENIGFDSGAYKQVIFEYGFEYLKEFDEIILANDSVYGPIFSLDEMFNKMESQKDTDFWGITAHPKYNNQDTGIQFGEHIQSYFIVFNKNIISSDAFIEYWNSLKQPSNYDEAIEFFELYTTEFYGNKGFKYASYIKKFTLKEDKPYFYDTIKNLKEERLPFIKRKMFKPNDTGYIEYNIAGGINSLLEYIENNTQYDTQMIYQNIKRLYYNNKTMKKKLLFQYIFYLLKQLLLPFKWNHYKIKISKVQETYELYKKLGKQH